MGYQALYRKYRPRNFDEVAGQEITIKILKNSISKNKISHAYIFFGPRGTGKTSIAKILARTINCDDILNCNPCNECSKCRASISKECVDIIEIDAASNNGVDEIREIKNKVTLVPSELKYKVYIIDEVHMLSIGAFNALLKTLEEPPEHVIFILATTELHKVPQTILSRCQSLEFKKIPKSAMLERLKNVCGKENIKIEENALSEIANCSDGAMRDALSLLDKALAYSEEKITIEDIKNITGNITFEVIDNIANKILEKDKVNLLNEINALYDSGKDLIKISEDLVINLRDKLIKETNDNNIANICLVIKKINGTIEKMRNSTTPKILLEVSLIELCILDNIESNININYSTNNNNKIQNVQSKEINISTTISKENEKNNIPQEPIKIENNNINAEKVDVTLLKKIRINNTFATADKQELLKIKNCWSTLNNYTFDKDFGALVCDMLDATPVAASRDNIILTYNYESFVDKGNSLLNKYNELLKKLLKLEHKIIFITSEEWNEEKNKYIINLKNNIKYNMIDEKQEMNKKEDSIELQIQSEENSNLIDKALELFGKENVEIN